MKLEEALESLEELEDPARGYNLEFRTALKMAIDALMLIRDIRAYRRPPETVRLPLVGEPPGEPY